MIFGIGTDMATASRFTALYERNPQRTLEKFLAPGERNDCAGSVHPGRFLAKRFAAKEALGKALGTGIREPVLLPAIEIVHDALGKPSFAFLGPLATFIAERQLTLHLSIADEEDHALAFVVAERL